MLSKPQTKSIIKTTSTHSKNSFKELAHPDSEILILGTMPGDASLAANEYYAHPRNRLWKIIATVTKEAIPENYEQKKTLLQRHKIALWDFCKHANRKGSLDAAISNETPNDLIGFLKKHSKVKVIVFNGAKPKTLFDKYFTVVPEIKYLGLPSTSAANARINLENICLIWQSILY